MALEPGIDSVQLARTWAALPAAGAWDDDPEEIECAGAEWATIWARYQQGDESSGGGFSIRCDASPYTRDAGLEIVGNQVWGRTVIKQLDLVTFASDSAAWFQREGTITYGATGADAEDILVGLSVFMGAAQRLRIAAREAADGDTDEPGSLELTVVLGSTGGQNRVLGV